MKLFLPPTIKHSAKRLVSVIINIVILLILTGCSNEDTKQNDIPGDKILIAKEPLLNLLPSGQTGIDFKNSIIETAELNITNHINNSNGGGVAIFDANNDGLQDIYFVSTSEENKFYVNLGNFKFRDATEGSGLESNGGFEIAVTAVDINTDGYLDLYVCRAGLKESDDRRNKLFVNNKDLTFSELASEYGLDDKSASIGANFFDYDLDGDLDLYLVNYPIDFTNSNKINVRPTKDSTTVEPILEPISEYDTDRFYRNDGPVRPDGSGGFVDVSKEAGVWNFGYGMCASIEDFNGDGWPDVYVANDFIQPDILYINNRNGTFTNKLGEYFKHTSQHTMGVDLSDIDNDGLFDLFAVDMLSNTNYRRKTLVNTNNQNSYRSLITHNYFPPIVRNVLQHNNGNFTFSDIACLAGVYQTDWSWSALMADLDNDGWKDLMITNGYQRELTDMDFRNFTVANIKTKGTIAEQFPNIHDLLALIPQYKIRDFVFQNKGDLTFEDKSGQWLTSPATWSNGAATADLDNDGDLDYIVNNIEDEAFVYENLARNNHNNNYLQIVCKGPPLNLFGVGTRATLHIGNKKQYQLLNPSKGIFSSVEHIMHFGLGSDSNIDSIIIRWPDNKTQILRNIPSNQRMEVKYSDAKDQVLFTAQISKTIFNDITKKSGLNFKHKENDYIDFEYYFLLPWTLSDLGPLVASADINNDGLTDLFISNSFGKPRGIYFQTKEGKFIIDPDQWYADSIYEDHGALFFDADMDKDLDLLIIGGGHEAVAPEAWQSRLYINDNSQFKYARGAIPLLEGVALRATAIDYDLDGDMDVIIGGRVKPGKYPLAPKSYVLRNDRNHFVDVTAQVAPELNEIGMVTDLQVANVDNDPAPELIIAGEWMPITIFKIIEGKFKKLDSNKTGLSQSNGYWNKLSLNDLDNDGDLDIVAGNLGLNTIYKPSISQPLQCYVSDYDQNGSIDPILTYYEGDNIYPMVQKDVLIKQIPSMKKKFVYYKDYANATIEDVLTPKQITESLILNAYLIESGWWENTSGSFIFHSFPKIAQASPVNGIIVHDFDNDQKLDIFLAGNKYGMEVESGRMDAGIGVLLKGDGHGQFTWIKNTESGIWASKDVRDIALLHGPNHSLRIIITNNNDDVQVFEKSN